MYDSDSITQPREWGPASELGHSGCPDEAAATEIKPLRVQQNPDSECWSIR